MFNGLDLAIDREPFPSRAEVRAALRWWRANHPGRNVRTMHHGWYGWVLWTTDREAGVECQMMDVIRDYRAAGWPGA
jgi:hypothetical protein